jgi:hypothetical protein
MNLLIARSLLPAAAVALLLLAPGADAQNIYKCPQPGGSVAYTDHPCPSGKGELLHKADDSEMIDSYLRLGQDDLARKYASARHLDALYKERVAAYRQDQQEKAQREQDEALVAQQREEAARQQALLDQITDRNRLQAENHALRQQNDQYHDELTQPAGNNYPAAGWGVLSSPYYQPPYRHPGHEHEHDDDDEHHRPPPTEPVFHPCTQLAGGRVRC